MRDVLDRECVVCSLVAFACFLLVPLSGYGADSPSNSKPTVAELIKRLGSEDFKQRQEAYQNLINVGPPCLPQLREAVKSDDPEIARRAEICIDEIKQAWNNNYLEDTLRLKDMTLAEVLRLTRDERANMRRYATEQLYRWRKDPEAVAALLRNFRDDHVMVRRQAAAIAGLFLHDEEVLRVLIAALKDEDVAEESDRSISQRAADSFVGMDRPTPEAWAALIEAAKTGNDGLRCAAFRSVGLLASRNEELVPEAIKVLGAALRGKDYVKKQCSGGLRWCAAVSLADMKVKAKTAVPDLIEALRAEGAEDAKTAEGIRIGVLHAFRVIGPDAAAAVPDIMEIAKKKDISDLEQNMAIAALSRIDPSLKLPEPLPRRRQ